MCPLGTCVACFLPELNAVSLWDSRLLFAWGRMEGEEGCLQFSFSSLSEPKGDKMLCHSGDHQFLPGTCDFLKLPVCRKANFAFSPDLLTEFTHQHPNTSGCLEEAFPLRVGHLGAQGAEALAMPLDAAPSPGRSPGRSGSNSPEGLGN